MFYFLIGIFVATIIFEIVTKKKVAFGQVSNDSLTGGEMALTWVFCFFNPFMAGAILYYGWRNRLPTKAKSANRISWMAFVAFIIIAFAATTFGWT